MSVKSKQLLVSVAIGMLVGVLISPIVVTAVGKFPTKTKTENVPTATEFADWERAAAKEFVEATRDSCGKGNADDCELLTILNGGRTNDDIP